MKNILYTRKQIAAIIGVTTTQLRSWSKRPEWFSLPVNARKPIHRRDVLAAFDRVHRGTGAVSFIPETMLSRKELFAYYGINRTMLSTWKANGLPHFVFSDRIIRYVLKEVENWYLSTYGSRKSSTA